MTSTVQAPDFTLLLSPRSSWRMEAIGPSTMTTMAKCHPSICPPAEHCLIYGAPSLFQPAWRAACSCEPFNPDPYLDDNRGHSSQWSYNWSAVSSTSLVNTVTDPAGNDATHNFTDLSTQIGTGGACKFYETSTIRYKGSASANTPLERTDTSYNVTAIAVDDSSPGYGNIFATDVLTTVYPSGKVKKVHKDPDPGLGTGLPSFGNVIKQLDYDWGQVRPALSCAKPTRFTNGKRLIHPAIALI